MQRSHSNLWYYIHILVRYMVTKLGAVLSLVPGLPGANFSSSALSALESYSYSAEFKPVGRPGVPARLGPNPATSDQLSRLSAASWFWNYGNLVFGSETNILLYLHGEYDVDSEDHYWSDQRTSSIFKLTYNSRSKQWDINNIFSLTEQPEYVVPLDWFWEPEGGPDGTGEWVERPDSDDAYMAYRDDYVNLVTNADGSIVRLYSEWSNSSLPGYGDIAIRYLDIKDGVSTEKVEFIYDRIIASSNLPERGRNGDGTHHSYWLAGISATSTHIYYEIEHTSYTYDDFHDIDTEDREHLVFSDTIGGSNFSFLGSINTGYSNYYNYVNLGDNSSQGFTSYMGGALSVTYVNVHDWRLEVDYSKYWVPGDYFLTYLDSVNSTTASIDLPQSITPGSFVEFNDSIGGGTWEGFDVYTINDQAFVLRRYEESFSLLDGKQVHDIYAVYLDNGTLRLSSTPVKTITLHYSELGLTNNLINAIYYAFDSGYAQSLEFTGPNLKAFSLLDKSASPKLASAYSTYIGFQQKINNALVSAIEGKGNDTYFVDNSAISISEQFGSGARDLVYAACNYTLDETIELLTLTGTEDFNGTGNSKANLIIGNTGDNRLSGGGGPDTILGGEGDDIFVGGLGNDILDGQIGVDTVDYSAESTPLTITLGNGRATGRFIGTDTLRNMDNVVSGSGDDRITASTWGSTIDAGAGNDIITHGNGFDKITGGLGSDRFVVTSRSSLQSWTSLTLRPDHITDFDTVNDKIDSPLNRISVSGSIGHFVSQSITSDLLEKVFSVSSFARESAGYFTVESLGEPLRTFIAIQDKSIRYSSSDVVVEITGYTGSLSQLTSSNFV